MDTDNKILNVPVEDIIPNRFQPRLAFDDESLNDLSASIKEHGIIQPLVLRRSGDKYEIIAGERRYRAALKAGLTSIPGIVSSLSDKSSAEVAIVENIQRKNLSSIEEAKAYQSLLDNEQMNQEELARKMGISQGAISNKLRLLTLPREVQNAIVQEKVSERHARSLLKLNNSKDQVLLLEKTIKNRLTVKQLEDEIRSNYKTESPTTNVVDIDRIKTTAEDIDFKITKKPDVKVFEVEEKIPNKFFNFLEDEEVNLSVIKDQPLEEKVENSDEIEFLDITSSEEKSETSLEKIKSFIKTLNDINVLEQEENGEKTLIISVKKENNKSD